ncbi:MerR family transcriptional regulator [Herbidospora sp. NEAU-GS84]|uniref:MerR family transcriptional regulator n=1 Tax=Herbidospora solisilvae TaxID=2696284 RepID=A0A7C9N7Y4_9ACTN|nr:MerR family transcriptional regulator [Herbidospora solisilvae]NAS23553.1 MerR family transcriptional regulator [Herbidospora solisilvae]
MEIRHWRIGELTAVTGLTARALRHFEDIGLLPPIERSASGHRRYGEEDVRRLYRIVAMRELGIPLPEIARALDEEPDLAPMVREQLARVETRIADAQRLRRLLAGLLRLAPLPSAGQLIEVMKTMTQSSGFSPEQLARLRRRHDSDKLATWRSALADVVEELRACVAEEVDPADPRVQELAGRWSAVARDIAGGDLSVLSSMYAKLDAQGAAQATKGLVDEEVWEYVKRAFAIASALR